ncbi:MAG: OmpA family protein [Cytophagales bacterium]|nr:OmpA family protein [Cytophagales bacterium]
MKKILTLFLSLLTLASFAQDKTLMYFITVQNVKTSTNVEGATVVFENTVDKQKVEGTTSAEGLVNISLVQGQKYDAVVSKDGHDYSMGAIDVPVGNYAGMKITFPVSLYSNLLNYHVEVTNFEGVPEPNAKLVYTHSTTNDKLEAVTNAEGKVEVSLKKGEIYQLSIHQHDTVFAYPAKQVPLTEHSGVSVKYSIKMKFKEIFLLDIHFKSNDYQLSAKDKQSLNKFVKQLKTNPTMVVELAAHTDNVGNDDANMTLSQNRANSVKKYLISQGIEAKRLVAKGYGEKAPVVSNSTEKGRAQNRRTEVRIISN